MKSFSSFPLLILKTFLADFSRIIEVYFVENPEAHRKIFIFKDLTNTNIEYYNKL